MRFIFCLLAIFQILSHKSLSCLFCNRAILMARKSESILHPIYLHEAHKCCHAHDSITLLSIKPIRSLSCLPDSSECVNTYFYWGMKCPPSRFLLSKMLLGKVREILNRLSKWAIPSRARQLAIMLEIGNNIVIQFIIANPWSTQKSLTIRDAIQILTLLTSCRYVA